MTQSMQTSPLTSPKPNLSSNRRSDLDWLRVIAIIILLFYHTGMIYVSWGWHIQSNETSPAFENVMRWLHRWRMPLLFFISGAGTFFALKKRTYSGYAGERVKRLFIPLVFGMFVIVPPQIYLEWLFRGRFSGSYVDFYPNVFGFQPYQDGGTGGAFSWHHLWFVAYLFVYSLISIPVFRYLKTESGQRLTDRIERLLQKPGGALWLVSLLWLVDLTLGGFFPHETHALINDWAYFTKNLVLFWLGYMLVSRPGFAPTMGKQRRVYLVATLICTVILYSGRALIGPDAIGKSVLLTTLFSFNGLALTWFSVLMSVGYGHQYLNRTHPILPYLNEAVYPFYILHQTVIVIIGYWILKTNLGIYDGFLVVSLSTLVVCIMVYWFLIRPFKLTRLLFGVK